MGWLRGGGDLHRVLSEGAYLTQVGVRPNRARSLLPHTTQRMGFSDRPLNHSSAFRPRGPTTIGWCARCHSPGVSLRNYHRIR